MLGAVVGDVLGSIHEFNPIKTKNFELLDSDCFFTDDTVMTVAVADSLMNGIPYAESLQMCGSSYPSAGYMELGSINGFIQTSKNRTTASAMVQQYAPQA